MSSAKALYLETAITGVDRIVAQSGEGWAGPWNASIQAFQTSQVAVCFAYKKRIAEVDKAIDGVDARAASTRAGYVCVISNILSLRREKMVEVGMTRRLDQMERIR
ncbi:hypothetical protein AOQ73_28030 [Bradyrhizobium pachyrhizi]|uniref:hypothetical protein n=1 Tax=Bradyrhizobium pachyrhizi TaxID=280333 RepID=UPI0007053A39|nr:hypothetical protein [Bradyrhizobium pachyrhizi]KRP88651.1 hypothetical protein AOQ73_28030 [Bradyrhizobium pachyrhizi]